MIYSLSSLVLICTSLCSPVTTLPASLAFWSELHSLHSIFGNKIKCLLFRLNETQNCNLLIVTVQFSLCSVHTLHMMNNALAVLDRKCNTDWVVWNDQQDKSHTEPGLHQHDLKLTGWTMKQTSLKYSINVIQIPLFTHRDVAHLKMKASSLFRLCGQCCTVLCLSQADRMDSARSVSFSAALLHWN